MTNQPPYNPDNSGQQQPYSPPPASPFGQPQQPPAQQPSYPQPTGPQPGYGQQPAYGQQPTYPQQTTNTHRPTFHPGVASPDGSGAPRGKSSINFLGLLSLIAGAATSLLGFLFSLITAFVYAGGSDFSVIGALNGIQTILAALLAIAAVVLGGLVILRKSNHKALAAAGLALGLATLFGIITNLLYGLIISSI